MPGLQAKIQHVVVLMLENRSFDCMLGRLYQAGPGFDGLTDNKSNFWHQPGGPPQEIMVWHDPTLTARALCVPDPDPGELFVDMEMQIRGLPNQPAGPATSMSGFVDNYMRQPPSNPAADPYSPMHYFTPDQVPVISQLGAAFGVSDRWHASAPCQTWPNRFFVHTGTAHGYVNNSPTHFPYLMETVFERLAAAGQTWGIYFHDIPQSVTLARLWDKVDHFHPFERFIADAAAGSLPTYSFVEPRYFSDPISNKMPNDEHPPHNVAYGEGLIASVYNAVRTGPGWKSTMLIVTYDEHGGCYDHVLPPPAKSPGEPYSDGFTFDQFGVRVPSVIVSPYVAPGSIIRPTTDTPFDHTSIIATLSRLFDFPALTARDAAAPDLLAALGTDPDNDGPVSISASAVPPAPAQVARIAAKPPNDMQKALAAAALHLPTTGASISAHLQRLASVPDAVPSHPTAADALADIRIHVKAFLGTP